MNVPETIPGKTGGKFAAVTEQKRTIAYHTKEIIKLSRKIADHQPGVIVLLAEIGAHYTAVRNDLPPGKESAERWCREKLPGYDLRDLQRCAYLNKHLDDFEPAHAWYLKEGAKLGFVTPHKTGVRWALDVMKFYAAHLDGKAPPAKKPPRENRHKTEAEALGQQGDKLARMLNGSYATIRQLSAKLAAVVALAEGYQQRLIGLGEAVEGAAEIQEAKEMASVSAALAEGADIDMGEDIGDDEFEGEE